MTDSSRSFPFAYFWLVLGLSVPFWIAAALAPDLLSNTLGIRLPLSALMAFVPAFVALALVGRAEGFVAAARLLGRAFDFRRVKSPGWILAAVLLAPAAFAIEYGLLLLTAPHMDPPVFEFGRLPGFLVMFFVAGVGEELGWQAYAFERLEGRWNALQVSLALGGFWIVWHVIPFAQTGHDGRWIASAALALIPLRIITAWLYLASGRSLFVAAAFHAMCNVGAFMFPNGGSYYDPFLSVVVMGAVAVAVAILWGPRTLAGRRA